jgi:hypothetical protein
METPALSASRADAHRCDASVLAEQEMAAWREILDGAKGRSTR